MSLAQRCPTCGGSNPARAAWCTQCYEPLGSDRGAAGADAPDEPAPPAIAPPSAPPLPSRRPSGDVSGLLPLPSDQSSPAAAATDAAGAGEVSDARRLGAGDGRFRSTDEGLEWVCTTCGEWNPIERLTCTVCSAPFMGDREDAEVPPVEPAVLVAATVALPGAGHALLQQWGQAFFRGLLAIVWGVGGFALLVNALSSGQAALPAVPLLLGWFVLLAGSVNDVLVARGASGRVILQGRTVLWLVVGVVGATMAAAFLGAFTAMSG